MIQIAVKSTGQNDFGPYNNFAEVGGGRADVAILSEELIKLN